MNTHQTPILIDFAIGAPALIGLFTEKKPERSTLQLCRDVNASRLANDRRTSQDQQPREDHPYCGRGALSDGAWLAPTD